MKKLILILFASLALNVYGQRIKFSLRTGANYSFLSSTIKGDPSGADYISSLNRNLKNAKSEPKLGFYISPQIMVPINKIISFETGIGMSIKKMDVLYGRSTMKDSYGFMYLKLPVLLKLNFFTEKLVIKGGIGLNRIIDVTINTKSIKKEWEAYYIGMVIGIEYKLFNKIYLDLCFDRNFSFIENRDMLFQSYQTGLVETKLNSFSLGISYRFFNR